MLFVFFIILSLLFLRYNKYPLYLTLSRANFLKAVLPYGIILGHISFKTTNALLLDFRYLGVYVVSAFFFISGYGLEFKGEKGDVSISYCVEKTKKIIFSLFIPIIMYVFVNVYLGNGIKEILEQSIKTFSLIIPFTWFVIILVLMYFGYTIAKLVAKSSLAFFLFFVGFLLLLMSVFYVIGYDGTLYESNFCFLLGVYYRIYEKEILQYTNAHRKQIIFLAMAFLLLISCSYMSLKPIFRGFALIGTVVYSFSFFIVFSFITINNNKIVLFLKKYSFQVYLSQGISFALFSKVDIANIYIYTLLILFSSLMIAIFCKKLSVLLKLESK